jgi:hypothetical protein
VTTDQHSDETDGDRTDNRGDSGPREDPPQVRPDGDHVRQYAGTGTFGTHGWILVGMIVLSFLVLPTTVVFLPEMQAFLTSLGLGLRDAYLVLPLIPSILLAVTAVWAAMRARRR